MNPLIPFTILILSWSIDTTDPDVRKAITLTFLVIHALAAGVLIYVSIAIWRHGEATIIKVKDYYSDQMEAKQQWEYDASKMRELFLMKVGMAAGVSFLAATRFGIPFPLLLQCLNNPKAIYDSELFQIYVLKKPAVGELERPWREASVLPEWARNAWAQGEKESEAFMDRQTNSSTTRAKRQK